LDQCIVSWKLRHNAAILAARHGGASTAAGTMETPYSMTAVIKAAWSATAGAATLTNRHTIFRKVA
jgi:hypothetical protein